MTIISKDRIVGFQVVSATRACKTDKDELNVKHSANIGQKTPFQ